MSLLLDARKKAELALQQADGRNKASSFELSLEDAAPRSGAAGSDTGLLGATSPPGVTSPAAPSGAAAHAGNQRAAGENLFKAKAAPAHARMRLGFIPIVLICGVILAAAGGAYVWHEISPASPALTPPTQSTRPAPVTPSPLLAVAATTAQNADIHNTVMQGASEEAAPVMPDATGAPLSPKRQQRISKKSQKKSVASRSVTKMRQATEEGTASDDSRAIKIQHRPARPALDPALLTAYQAYQSGDFATADQHYRAVLQRDANNRDALLGLAAIAQQQSQDATAIGYYKRILALDPRDPVALAGLASLPSGTDATGTESRLKSLLAQQPQTPDARSAALHFVLGNHYAAQSRWGDAQQSYFNAYSLEPGNAQLAFNLAISLDHLQQTKLATQYYQRALQLDTANGAGFDHAQAQQRITALLAR